MSATARRTRHAADSESQVYAGRHIAGSILVRAGKITATDADGKLLGVFGTDKLAMAAILDAARSNVGRTA
jgi:hypothetical protein